MRRESANHLLSLVLQGKKTATASSYDHYLATGEEIPSVGSLSIVTDYDGLPYAVIRTKAVQLIPFKDLTYDIIKREGEDDSLGSWRKSHTRFYQEDGKINGYEFNEDMLVLFEDFEVIYQETH
jgi:uncharacterized protein YhfF